MLTAFLRKDKQKIGKLGEKIAKNYLKKKGYKILEQNYHTRYGEIDLVILKEEKIIFVEVKTRTSKEFGWPEESISRKKLTHLILAAQIFLQKNKLTKPWQIDCLSLEFNSGEEPIITHLENITV